LNGPKNEKKKLEKLKWLVICCRVGGTPVLPEELLEFAKSEEFV
jgi:hypothetical protein